MVLGRSRSRKRDGTYEATYTDLWPAIDQGAATLQPSIASRRHWDAKLSKARQPESDSGRAPSAARSLWGSSIALGQLDRARGTWGSCGHASRRRAHDSRDAYKEKGAGSAAGATGDCLGCGAAARPDRKDSRRAWERMLAQNSSNARKAACSAEEGILASSSESG